MTDQRDTKLGYINRDGLGRFVGSITDAATRERTYDEGVWSDIGEAVAWARSLAAQVVVAYGYHEDSKFSAGDVDCEWPHGVALPHWPPDEARLEEIDLQSMHEIANPKTRPGALGVVQPMIVKSEDEGDCQ